MLNSSLQKGLEAEHTMSKDLTLYSIQIGTINLSLWLPIHGLIDGYSHHIMWLEVVPSNNDPKVNAKYFIDCLYTIKGTPKFIRADCGTENIYIAGIQRFLRRDCADVTRGRGDVECFRFCLM